MKKNKKKWIVICLLVMVLSGGGVVLHYLKTHYITVSLAPKKQTEITGTLNRPGCGWYQLYSYYLQPGTTLSADDLYLRETDDDGYTFRLALLEFNLAEYSDSRLDASAIKNIRMVLQRFSKTKAKVIIRFLYDWDGLGEEKEPKKLSIITQHMEQTGKVLNDYCELIYTTQGIFVGNWAEMHGSKYLTPQDMTTLAACYANAANPAIYLAVRTPKQYRTILQELQDHPERYEKYHVTASRLVERLGLYNDGMLGSVSDTGTYFEADTAETEAESLAVRAKELAFQNELCQTVPNGGEVVNDNPFNDSENAIADLTKMHISYLNQIYDETVIQKWKKSTYNGSDRLYQNSSVYDYMTDHMGARYVLKDCTLSYRPLREKRAEGTLQIENKGFSAYYAASRFTLTLINKETHEETTIWDSQTAGSQYDIICWKSQETISIPFSFAPSVLSEGDYYLAARLTDSAQEEFISFANDSYDSTVNGYVLGTVTIKK